MKRIIYSIIIAILVGSSADARGLPAEKCRQIDAMITAQLNAGAFPGAAFIVGDREGIIYSRNYGYLDHSKKNAVCDTTLYDIASCTKVLSTTFALMYLYDNGKIELDEKIGEVVPRYAGSNFAGATIKELLTHTSGMGYRAIYPKLVANEKNGMPLMSSRKSDDYPYNVDRGMYMAKDVSIEDFTAPGAEKILDVIARESYSAARRGKYTYTDINFYLLKLAIEERSEKKLDDLTSQLMKELNCTHTGYNPLTWCDKNAIAPTEYDYLLRRGQIQGTPHDEMAAIAGGVGGNAGLFATARDIASFCEMLICNGAFHGKQILKPATVALFSSSPLASKGIYRGYGFDKRNTGALAGAECFGHTGYTGTMFWIDKGKGIYMVFLSNSVYPSRTNKQLVNSQLRVKLWQLLTGSL